MLLAMDQQHSTATSGGFMSSFNLAPFSMNLNEAASLVSTANSVVGNSNVGLLTGVSASNGNNGGGNVAGDVSVLGCGVGNGGTGSAYTAYGSSGCVGTNSILHSNNNNNNTSNSNLTAQQQQQQQQLQQQQQQQSQTLSSASHLSSNMQQHQHQQHQQQQQQQSHHQQQSHQHQQSHQSHNNYSMYNFDSQYGMFAPGGYAEASNQVQTQTGQQQQQHVAGTSVANSTNIGASVGGGGGGGNYMPLLPSLNAGGGNAIAGVVGESGGSLVGGGVNNNNNHNTTHGSTGSGSCGGSVANQSGSSCDQTTEIKYCFEELCPVCGDKVSGYHYGLLTCESCKGFFKRTVQNKKVYTCVAERQCHIDKTQRKRCPFCRFQKCLDVGMKLEAVRADRMRGGRNKFGPMYKRDRARKLQIMRQRQLAIQTLRAVEGNPIDSIGYPQSYHMNIKQEIQIPQISSLTSSSPDSSPSPIAIALGQVSASGGPSALTVGTTGSSSGSIASASGSSSSSGGSGSGSGGNGNGGNGNGNGGGGGGTSSSCGVVAGSGVLSGQGSGCGGSASNSSSQTVAGSNGSTNSIPSTTTSSSTVHNSTPTDSKQWFVANSTTASPHSLSPKPFNYDSGSNPTSTADAGPVAEPLSKKQNWKNSKSLNFPRVSPMIREFVQSVDDREWQQQLFSLLQSQSYNQCEVDVFELMCKVLDQNLFSQVDWARNTVFFKDLKVDDQMKLLQNSWSDMLVLDHLHQRIHNNLQDETTLHNGQKFDLLGLGLLGVPQLSDHFNELQCKLVELKFDVGDYICMKFLQLLNPDFADVRGITNKKTVLEGYENVQAALLDYTLTCYPTVTDKFSKLVSIIPEIHSMAARGEEHLYVKHCAGSAPTQTLLMEMLHAKRK